jgi:hypothetical protein
VDTEREDCALTEKENKKRKERMIKNVFLFFISSIKQKRFVHEDYGY